MFERKISPGRMEAILYTNTYESHKDGSYRRIQRLYSKVLRISIENNIKGRLPEEKTGFKAGRYTMYNTFTLKIAMER